MTRARVSSQVRLPPFQALLDAHGRDVQRFLIASVGPVDADDCYQETWLAALRAYPDLRDASNLRSWIFTIAHRKVIDHARARARRAVPVGEVSEPVAAAAGLLDVADAEHDSPVGRLLLAGTPAGLVRLAYLDFEDEDAVLEDIAARISPRVLAAPGRLDEPRRELDEYFGGGRRR